MKKHTDSILVLSTSLFMITAAAGFVVLILQILPKVVEVNGCQYIHAGQTMTHCANCTNLIHRAGILDNPR